MVYVNIEKRSKMFLHGKYRMFRNEEAFLIHIRIGPTGEVLTIHPEVVKTNTH
jgi:hypothetical protein